MAYSIERFAKAVRGMVKRRKPRQLSRMLVNGYLMEMCAMGITFK